MREIKFRAWFPKGTDTGDGEIEKGEMCYDLAFEDYEPINDLLSGVEHLMQYTGLKDKNGKEIYEGDIVKTPGAQILPVEIDYVGLGDSKFWSIGLQNCEVIGNIHENPDS